MGKRLILLLALGFMVGMAFNAYAEVQSVKVGGEVNAMYISRDLDFINTHNVERDEAFASIAKVRVDADLTDNVGVTVGLLNERYWGNETENGGVDSSINSEIALDLAYVTLKEFLYSPLTVTVGRQLLRFGNAMIIGDPDTNNLTTTASPFGATGRDADLSARKSFDAIRATLDYDPLTIDAIYSQITEGVINTNDDVTLFGVNLNYAIDDTTTVEGYYFGEYTGHETADDVISKSDRIDCVGGRIAGVPIENLSYSLEAAYQFGRRVVAARPTQARRAWAVEALANYTLSDVKYTPALGLVYGYFSGGKGNDEKIFTAWDPMFEDQTAANIANALFDQTNVHQAGLIVSAKPLEDVTLKLEGYGFWWDKQYGYKQLVADRRGTTHTFMHNKYAATEVDLKAAYDYTEDVQMNLLVGILIPGESFDKQTNNPATEVIGSMKVTF